MVIWKKELSDVYNAFEHVAYSNDNKLLAWISPPDFCWMAEIDAVDDKYTAVIAVDDPPEDRKSFPTLKAAKEWVVVRLVTLRMNN